jgi:hypothetical protein
MALIQQAIYQELLLAKSAAPFPMEGAAFEKLAMAISYAVPVWGVGQQSNLALTGIAAGTAGTGTITPPASKVTVPPNFAATRQGIKGAGLNGPLAESLGIILTIAISSAFSKGAQYAGTSVSVGVGADISKVTTANTGSLIVILQGFMFSFVGQGAASPNMAKAVAGGITELLKGGVGAGTVVGVPSPSAGSGPTNSVVV